MYKEIIEKIKPDLEKTLNFQERELAKIHVSGISPSLIENAEIECFGQKMPLKQLGSVSSQGPRRLVIQPWDKSYLQDIVRSLEKSNLNLSLMVDKDLIRINLPPLSEEYRKDLLKLVSEKKEQARITVRKWRDKIWDEIQEKFKEGEIREDDKFKGKEELQKLVDDYNSKIKEIAERKEKEILEE